MEYVEIIFPIINHLNPTNEESVGAMMTGLKKLAANGAISQNIDEVLKDYKINDSNGYAIAIIDKKDLIDASKLGEIGSSSAPVFELPVELSDPDFSKYVESFRNFSMATINERLRMAKADSKIKLRYLIMDYKRYWNANKNKFNDLKSAKALRNMFLTDMMGLFNDILPLIQEGKQLATLLGINSVTKNMNTMAKDLSLSYKRALNAQEKSGIIPKSMFNKLKVDYNKFMTELLEQVMPGLNQVILDNMGNDSNSKDEKLVEGQVEQSLVKSFSTDNKNSIISVETNNPKELSELLNYIKEIGNDGHSFNIVIDPDNNEYRKEFGWDGDGADRIQSITIIEGNEGLDSKDSDFSNAYEFSSDGRIKLF